MRKVKLFFSIAVLCLCLSVFCLGVYSAVSVSYTVGGSVSYTVVDAMCEITTKVYKNTTKRTQTELESDVSTLSKTTFSNISYTVSQEFETYNSLSGGGASSATGINIDFTKNSSNVRYNTYYIVVNVKNLSDAPNMYAYLSGTNSETNVIKFGNYSQEKILMNEENRNIVLAYSLNDEKVGIDNLSFNYTLTVQLGTQTTRTVSFDKSNSTLTTSSQTVKYDGAYGTLPTPTRSGYTFAGWYVKNQFNPNMTAYKTGYYIGVNGALSSYNDYNVYKLPIKAGLTYSIVNSGLSSAPGYAIYDSSGTVLASKNYGETVNITFTAPTNSSYILFSVVVNKVYRYDKEYFAIYSADDIVTSSTTYVYDYDITLVPKWEEGYTITFNANGGTVSESKRHVQFGSSLGTLPTPTLSGKTFAGWYINQFDQYMTAYGSSQFIGVDGAITSNGEYCIYKLPVIRDLEYTIRNSGKSTAPGYAIYSSSGSLISSANYANTSTITFTTGSDANYILFSVVTNSSYRQDKEYFAIYSTKDKAESSTVYSFVRDITLVAKWK